MNIAQQFNVFNAESRRPAERAFGDPLPSMPSAGSESSLQCDRVLPEHSPLEEAQALIGSGFRFQIKERSFFSGTSWKEADAVHVVEKIDEGSADALRVSIADYAPLPVKSLEDLQELFCLHGPGSPAKLKDAPLAQDLRTLSANGISFEGTMQQGEGKCAIGPYGAYNFLTNDPQGIKALNARGALGDLSIKSTEDLSLLAYYTGASCSSPPDIQAADRVKALLQKGYAAGTDPIEAYRALTTGTPITVYFQGIPLAEATRESVPLESLDRIRTRILTLQESKSPVLSATLPLFSQAPRDRSPELRWDLADALAATGKKNLEPLYREALGAMDEESDTRRIIELAQCAAEHVASDPAAAFRLLHNGELTGPEEQKRFLQFLTIVKDPKIALQAVKAVGTEPDEAFGEALARLTQLLDTHPLYLNIVVTNNLKPTPLSDRLLHFDLAMNLANLSGSDCASKTVPAVLKLLAEDGPEALKPLAEQSANIRTLYEIAFDPAMKKGERLRMLSSIEEWKGEHLEHMLKNLAPLNAGDRQRYILMNGAVRFENFDSTLSQKLGSLNKGGATVIVQRDRAEGYLPTLDELRETCREIAQDAAIPFEYIYDGCYARAHVICDTLRKKGMNRSKLFVNGNLAARNQYQNVSWGWHVAPVVFVYRGLDEPPAPYVLDPSFSPEPLTPEDWLACFWRSGNITVTLTSEHKYMDYDSQSGDFENNLASARQTLAGHAQALKQLKGA